jgi:hypothetical protein
MSKQVNEVAYRLDLPSSMKIHPVFHVSLLEPYRELAIPGRLPAPRHQSRLVEKKNLKFLRSSTLASIEGDYNILYIGRAMK